LAGPDREPFRVDDFSHGRGLDIDHIARATPVSQGEVVSVRGDTDHLDRVAQDQATHGPLAWTGRHRGGSHDDAGGLIAGETADPGDGNGDANSQEHDADDNRDPAQVHDVEVAAALDLLVVAQMSGDALGELVRRETLRPFHRVVRIDTHRRVLPRSDRAATRPAAPRSYLRVSPCQ
jgi:hypothetical protein